MRIFTVADSPEGLAQNRGVEIMASSFEEARDKAEALRVPARQDKSFLALSDEGFYTITDGNETRDIECEFVTESLVDIEGEEGPELL